MVVPRKKWQLLFKGQIEDFDNSSKPYWRGKSSTEKFRETRSLIEQVMNLKGIKYSDVSRLLRTTAVLKRQ